MTLYELTDELEQLRLMAEDPDVSPDVLADTIEAVEGELEVKAEGYAKVMKELEAEAEILDKEAKRLTERKKHIENSVTKMKASLKEAMEKTGKMKFRTDLFSFGIQKNPPSLVVDVPMDGIPEDYLIPQPPKVDTTKAKADLKNGELDWCHLEQGTSLRIR